MVAVGMCSAVGFSRAALVISAGLPPLAHTTGVALASLYGRCYCRGACGLCPGEVA